MTLEQVKKDLAAGRSDTAYYSANTLWWTHLLEDLEDATKQGRAATIKRHEKAMSDPEVPEIEKKKRSALFELVNKYGSPPLDPSGSVLMQCPLKAFIEKAEKNPSHFGAHGLYALMYAHHSNGAHIADLSDGWGLINFCIDIKNIGNKCFTVAQIRELLNQLYNEEISFSRFVEILNQIAESRQ